MFLLVKNCLAVILETIYFDISSAPEDSVDMVPTTDSGLHENWRSYDPMVTQAGVRPLPHAETITASQPDFSVPAVST